MEGHTCLTGHDVGLTDQSGSSPTRFRRKEGAGLPRRRQRGHGGIALLHRTHEVGEVSGRRVSKAGRKRLFPGSGDLLMQISEKQQLPPLILEFTPLRNCSSSFEERDSRGSSGPIQRELLSGARKHVHELRIGR